MKFSSVFFTAALSVSTFANPLAKRDVATVRADLATLTTQVRTLDTTITNYSGGLAGALTIHTQSVTVVTTTNKATTDTQATAAWSVADGRNILNDVLALEPLIIHSLQQIVVKKPIFVALPAGGIPAIVAQDLRDLGAATTRLEDALIAKTPASQVAEATAVKTRVDAAFRTAVAAYS
ncbi:hydrophobic surface binding protein [Pterulicium gracile]|uniref:Hydrophobic surface binding protein n=1 Tax=Pterulicium gracile TaxID=1884261 RepID=A0A5C3Q5F1_9AGAR|nr:hydrophobic surface binding protein [Pterula gracilis]